jgi:hypothetical protein
MLLLMPRVCNTLLLISCRTAESSMGAVYKALDHCALLSCNIPQRLVAISCLKQVRNGLCKSGYPLIVE